jgi:hypothetical protein
VKAENGADLKKLLADYGAIIIKIVDGKIGKKEVDSFFNSLFAYAIHRRRKNAVALAIMIGREITPEAYSAHAKATDLLLIEEP